MSYEHMILEAVRAALPPLLASDMGFVALAHTENGATLTTREGTVYRVQVVQEDPKAGAGA